MNELKNVKKTWDDAHVALRGIRIKIDDALCNVLNKHGVIKVDLSEFSDKDYYVCAGDSNWGWCSEVRLNKHKYPISKVNITLKDGEREGDFGLLDLIETEAMFYIADMVVKALENN